MHAAQGKLHEYHPAATVGVSDETILAAGRARRESEKMTNHTALASLLQTSIHSPSTGRIGMRLITRIVYPTLHLMLHESRTQHDFNTSISGLVPYHWSRRMSHISLPLTPLP